MWRRIYLLLLLLRVYFALSPSYLHPDEIFQGPEVISGSVFPYPVHRTWEWTSQHPIRSVFPIWLCYGLPMSLLKCVWTREDNGLVDPAAIYYALRLLMFTLCFVLEDWAIYELVHSPRRRSQVVLLVASSYVTWTFQTHTFSNAIETLLVLWCLVLMERIVKGQKRTSITSSFILGFLLVLGFCNRITFPAFVLIPGMRLLPHFLKKPFSFCAISVSTVFWIFIAIATDTAYYGSPDTSKSFRALFTAMRNAPVITTFNNIMYNTQTSNLAQHGLHPHYQHILINLPQLLGPALVLLLMAIPECTSSKLAAMLANPRLTSAATGTVILSIIPHQESRFLLPCIPLLLTCLHLPRTPNTRRYFWVSWAIFNAIFGVLMGVYHQGGIIPAQLSIPSLVNQSQGLLQSKLANAEVFWWKTYPPPTYLLGSNHTNPTTTKPLNISSVPLMGMNQNSLLQTLSDRLPSCQPDTILDKISNALSPSTESDVYLAAPFSAWRLDQYPMISNFTFSLEDNVDRQTKSDNGDGITSPVGEQLHFSHLSTFRKHLNLDDMDFGDDGVVSTLTRVVGRRGLGVWHVERNIGFVGDLLLLVSSFQRMNMIDFYTIVGLGGQESIRTNYDKQVGIKVDQ